MRTDQKFEWLLKKRLLFVGSVGLLTLLIVGADLLIEPSPQARAGVLSSASTSLSVGNSCLHVKSSAPNQWDVDPRATVSISGSATGSGTLKTISIDNVEITVTCAPPQKQGSIISDGTPSTQTNATLKPTTVSATSPTTSMTASFELNLRDYADWCDGKAPFSSILVTWSVGASDASGPVASTSGQFTAQCSGGGDGCLSQEPPPPPVQCDAATCGCGQICCSEGDMCTSAVECDRLRRKNDSTHGGRGEN